MTEIICCLEFNGICSLHSQSHNARHFLDTNDNALYPSMAVLRCLIVLIYLDTALCVKDSNATGNVNITLRDANDTSADRNESLDFTDLGVWTPESVTALPVQTESSESSIPATSPESPRAATAALPLSSVLPAAVTEGENAQPSVCDALQSVLIYSCPLSPQSLSCVRATFRTDSATQTAAVMRTAPRSWPCSLTAQKESGQLCFEEKLL